MGDLENIYKESFFNKRKSLIWRAEVFCDILIKGLFDNHFKTIIDIGCAIGEFVWKFNQMNYYAVGIEGSEAARKYLLDPSKIEIFDIRKPIPTRFHGFDFCMCLEVAEHIEEKYSDIFVDNLCKASNKILLTAAQPGQKGHGHFNCQPKQYWMDKFIKRNFQRKFDEEDKIINLLYPYRRKKGLSGYYGNLMIFERIKTTR